MTTNPFRCQTGGIICTVNSRFTVTMSTDDCALSTPLPAQLTARTMLKAMCPHRNVGHGTIVFGARWTYSNWLAVAVNAHPLPSSTPGPAYALTCSVNTRNAFKYRNITLSFHDATSTNGGFNRILWSNGPCIPTHTSTITVVLFAVSAAGP